MGKIDEKKKPKTHITNFQKVKEMTIDELAAFFVQINSHVEPCMTGEKDCKWEDYPTHDKDCKDCFRAWLEKEIKG